MTLQKKENYRQISVRKIKCRYSKDKLATRIQPCVRGIVQYDQLGFVSGMQGWFDIQKQINVIYHINKLTNKSHMIILIDAESI